MATEFLNARPPTTTESLLNHVLDISFQPVYVLSSVPRAQTVDCVLLPTNLFDPDIPTDIGRHHVADRSLGHRHLLGLCPAVSAAERVLGQECQG